MQNKKTCRCSKQRFFHVRRTFPTMVFLTGDGDPSSSTRYNRQPSLTYSFDVQTFDEDLSSFTLSTEDDNLGSTLHSDVVPVYNDTTSEMSSITPSASASQITNDDPNNPPRIPGKDHHNMIYYKHFRFDIIKTSTYLWTMIGQWGDYFSSRCAMESGRRIFKFFCLQPGCQASFSKTSSSSTLSYHMKAVTNTP